MGNQSVGGDYPYIATMGTNGEMGYLVDGKKIASVSPGGIVSPYLTWETVRQIDLGLDWALLNSRLYGTFDWYMRKTLDMVTNGTPLPAVLGTGAPQPIRRPENNRLGAFNGMERPGEQRLFV